MRSPNNLDQSGLDGPLHEPCKGTRPVEGLVQMPCQVLHWFGSKVKPNGPLNGPCGCTICATTRGGRPDKAMSGQTPRGSTRAAEVFTTRGAFRGGHALASQGTKVKARFTSLLTIREGSHGPWGQSSRSSAFRPPLLSKGYFRPCTHSKPILIFSKLPLY